MYVSFPSVPSWLVIGWNLPILPVPHVREHNAILQCVSIGIARSEHDDYCAETSFRLWVKRSSPFESARVSAHTAARRQGGSIWQAMTCLSFSNSWVTHSIPLFTLSSPFLAHLCVITFRMSYNTSDLYSRTRTRTVPFFLSLLHLVHWIGGTLLILGQENLAVSCFKVAVCDSYWPIWGAGEQIMFSGSKTVRSSKLEFMP
jgi:hypothetical protein